MRDGTSSQQQAIEQKGGGGDEAEGSNRQGELRVSPLLTST